MINKITSSYVGFSLIAYSLLFSGLVLSADYKSVGSSTVISFESGKSTLTKESKEKLKSLLSEAKAKGVLDEVQIATWSDNPIPADKKALSKADRELASRRSRSLKNYIEKPLGFTDITIHNMAERSTWLSRMFETNDAELKNEITKGSDSPMSKEEFKTFKDNGKPSVAVVLTIVTTH